MKSNSQTHDRRPSWRDARPAATESTKSIVGLDDDIFAPANAQRAKAQGPLPLGPITSRPWSPLDESWSGKLSLQCFFHDAGLGVGASSNTLSQPERTDVPHDDERQRFRELLAVALNRVSVLENTVTEQSADLALCRAQIADLCDMRNQQAAELQAAKNEIEQLTESAAAFQAEAAERESEVADALHRLTLADNDRAASQTQLDDTLNHSAGLSQRLLEVNMLLNDRETAIASKQEQFDRLNEALVEVEAEKRELEIVVDDLRHQHRHELKAQSARFEALLGRIKVVVAKRNEEIQSLKDAHSALEGRCNELVKSIEVMKSAEQRLQAKIDSRTGLVGILESQLRAEREHAERTIDELKAELQRVRSDHAGAERTLEEICKDITLLLPEFAARRNWGAKPRFEVAASQMQAA